MTAKSGNFTPDTTSLNATFPPMDIASLLEVDAGTAAMLSADALGMVSKTCARTTVPGIKRAYRKTGHRSMIHSVSITFSKCLTISQTCLNFPDSDIIKPLRDSNGKGECIDGSLPCLAAPARYLKHTIVESSGVDNRLG